MVLFNKMDIIIELAFIVKEVLEITYVMVI